MDWVRRLCVEEDGSILATEGALWTTIIILSMAVGVVTVRFAVAGFFHDEVESIAATSNLFTFDTASTFYCEKTTPDFNFIFSDLGTKTAAPRPNSSELQGS